MMPNVLIMFPSLNEKCTKAYRGHGTQKFLFRLGELLFRLGELLFRRGELLFRLGELLVRRGEIAIRLGELSVRHGEIELFTNCTNSPRRNTTC